MWQPTICIRMCFRVLCLVGSDLVVAKETLLTQNQCPMSKLGYISKFYNSIVVAVHYFYKPWAEFRYFGRLETKYPTKNISNHFLLGASESGMKQCNFGKNTPEVCMCLCVEL